MQRNYFKFENYPQRTFPVYSSVRENEKHPFGFHYHKDGEVLKIVSGTIKVSAGAKQYVLNEGDIMFFSPYTVHGATSLTDKIKTHAVTFDTALLKDKVDFTHTSDTHYIFKKENPANAEVSGIFDNMFDAYWNKPPAYKLKILANLMLLSSILTERGFILSYDGDETNFRTLPAVEYIKENYNREIKIPELSSMLNFCPDHFIRIFKEENKKTPAEYIVDYRIEEALKLLSEKKYSVSEIADMTGFSSASHFIKVFKQKLNTTPGKYSK